MDMRLSVEKKNVWYILTFGFSLFMKLYFWIGEEVLRRKSCAFETSCCCCCNLDWSQAPNINWMRCFFPSTLQQLVTMVRVAWRCTEADYKGRAVFYLFIIVCTSWRFRAFFHLFSIFFLHFPSGLGKKHVFFLLFVSFPQRKIK